MDLIFAFEPFNNEKENISKKVALLIAKNALVLPVKFDSNGLINKINAEKPTRIIGIGRCRKGKLVRIERKATNLKEENSKALGKISEKSPFVRFSTLKIKSVFG